MFIPGLIFLLTATVNGKAENIQRSIMKNATAESSVSESDSIILVNLYNSTDGPNWTNRTNWLTGPISTWYGITVKSDKVTEIRLKNNNVKGTIPAGLAQLSALEFLDLDTNKLIGNIPIEFGQLSNLQYLYLGGNQLSGTIPYQLGQLTNLVLLYLNNNQLTGSIPPELGLFKNLKWLNLKQNQLSGEIPVELTDLDKLEYLELGKNQLTGLIPAELMLLKNLKWLVLNSNQLTGAIPVELQELTNLEQLYLNNNLLTGSIPAELGRLAKLKWLNLGYNQLTGNIPVELLALQNLSLLYLDGNLLDGNIPPEIGQMSNLQWLNFGNNKLTGMIPEEIGQLPNLSLLYLNQNELTGNIPPQVGQLTNLQWFSLEHNQLSGSIPSEISQMNRLKYMEIQFNQLDSLPDLTMPDSIVSLDISSNKFTFEDLEYNMDLNKDISFIYSPQDSIDENQSITKERDESFSYDLITGGAQNNYQWYKNGVLLNSQTTATINIDNLTRKNSGEYYCQVSNTIVPDLILTSRIISLLVNDTTESSIQLTFIPGWSMFSSPVMPDSSDMKTIFQPLIDNNSLVKIQDELGNSLENWKIFGGWQNNIGDIKTSEGYRIKLDIPDSLKLYGLTTEFPYAISLQSGWNIMGYPQTTAFDGMNLVQQLINNGTLIKVQDEAGNSIENWKIFGGWQNNIGEFLPGKGYKIKLNATDTLWIYDTYPKSVAKMQKKVATKHFIPEFEGNGVDHMNLNLVGLPINVLNAGDELAVFDGETCVGTVVLMQNHLKSQTVSVVASAKDNMGMKGFNEGNPVTLKLWNARQNQEFILEPEILAGTSVFIKNETAVASLDKYIVTGLNDPVVNLNKINCYPNPFNDELTIEINLPNEAKGEVEVLNQLGQKVKIITTESTFSSGTTQLNWNGTISGNEQVSSGIYYVKLRLDGETIIKKVVYREFN